MTLQRAVAIFLFAFALPLRHRVVYSPQVLSTSSRRGSESHAAVQYREGQERSGQDGQKGKNNTRDATNAGGMRVIADGRVTRQEVRIVSRPTWHQHTLFGCSVEGEVPVERYRGTWRYLLTGASGRCRQVVKPAVFTGRSRVGGPASDAAPARQPASPLKRTNHQAPHSPTTPPHHPSFRALPRPGSVSSRCFPGTLVLACTCLYLPVRACL